MPGRPVRRRSMGWKRGICVGAVALMAIGLGPVVSSAAEMTDREKQLYEAAKANGETVTWYVSQHTSETAEAIGKAFREKYPGVGAGVMRSTAQVAFQRLSQDMRDRTSGVEGKRVSGRVDFGGLRDIKK